MSARDTEIDALYALPLSAFTAARNQLARTLKGPDAAAVRALHKPAAVPWAVNQLYWSERHTYERLMKAGLTLRRAQLAVLQGTPSDLPAATAAHRDALAAAASSASRIAATRGTEPPMDALTRMLEAVSLLDAATIQPGRFVDLVQPAGLEALAGLSVLTNPAPPPTTTRTPNARATSTERAAERELARARQAAERAAADAALKHAVTELAQARASEQRAQALAALAQQQLDNATRSIRDAQAAVARAERAVEAATGVRDALATARDRQPPPRV